MKPLRAYLMVRRDVEDWTTSVHRDLDSIEEAWAARPAGALGVLHIGFSRPLETSLEPVIAGFEDRLLLTGAALAALPDGHTRSSASIARVGKDQLFLALAGWGYDAQDFGSVEDGGGGIEPAQFAIDKAHPFAAEYQTRTDWLRSLQGDSAFVARLERCGIVGESSYLSKESTLPDELREVLGWERYGYYTGMLPCEDSLIRNLRFAPPWLLAVDIESLHLSTRAMNALRQRGIVRIRDFLSLGTSGVRSLDNVGRKSADEIAIVILDRFARGPWRARSPLASRISAERRSAVLSPSRRTLIDAKHLDKPEADSASQAAEQFPCLADALKGVLGMLPDKRSEVMRLRMGFSGDRVTLEEVGDVFRITRERVRQIEKSACHRVARLPVWQDMRRKIAACLRGRTTPLPVSGLEILDPWFFGIDQIIRPFSYALKNFGGGEFGVLHIDETLCISALDASEWERAIFDGRQIVDSFVGQNVEEAAVRIAVDGLLMSDGIELRDELWRRVTANAHFAGDLRVLISSGAGVEHAVQAVLAESAVPLHYTEIGRRCSERLGRNIEVRRAHNAAGNVALLFGRGTYGLRRHLRFSDVEIAMIVDAAEDLILGHEQMRQWHAHELVVALKENGFDYGERLNGYVLSLVLAASEKLASLKRLVWVARGVGAQGSADRIDVGGAIEAILLEAGHPLSGADIREAISKSRGVSSYFQIHSGGGVIRVAPGIWGLIERDVPLNDQEIEDIVTALQIELESTGVGLHMSEIAPTLLRWGVSDRAALLDPALLIDLASRDASLQVARGQILYLSAWGDSRSLTLSDAIRQSLESAGEGGARFEDIEIQVRQLLSREVTKQAISDCLRDFGASFSKPLGTWKLDDVDEEEVSV